GTDGATYPFWSPDGRFIGFFADRKLKKTEAAGGAVQTICAAPNGRGADWSRDGTVVFTPEAYGGLARGAAGGGSSTPPRPGPGRRRQPSPAALSPRRPAFPLLFDRTERARHLRLRSPDPKGIPSVAQRERGALRRAGLPRLRPGEEPDGSAPRRRGFAD